MRIKTIFPALAVLAMLAGSLFASAELPKLSTTVLSAAPARTVLRMEIPREAIDARLQQLEFGTRVSDGFGELLAISGQGTPTARVVSVATGDAVNPAGIAASDIADSPEELAIIGTPFIVHDLRIVAVNALPLLRGADGVVRAVTSLEMEVTTCCGGGINEKSDPTSLSYAFADVYRRLVCNLDAFPELERRNPGRFLIIGTRAMVDEALPNAPPWLNYLDLKRRKGFTVQIASTLTIFQTTGDSSQAGIRQYISQTYHDPALPSLDYALVVGDNSGVYPIPAYSLPNPENGTELSYGDNDYFTVDGDDYISDVLHGRIPCQTPQDVITYVNKVIRYETTPFRDDDQWFHGVTCVAGNFSDGSGTYPVTPVWNVAWARERLLASGCVTDADTFFYHDPTDPPPGSFTQPIINDINAGVSLVLYRGWADSQCWQYPVFCVQHVDQLAVGTRNPAFFAIVCGSANFAVGNQRCLGEELILTGTPTNSAGAIVYYGASDLHTNTRHNNAILSGIIEALLVNGIRSTGGLTFAGELEGYRQFPRERDVSGLNSGVRYYIFHAMNILGDPEVPLLICGPTEFVTYAPTQITLGENIVGIGVAAQGEPMVDNAVVTIRTAGQSDFVTTKTNAGGQAWLPVNFAATGTAEITVWKGGHFLKTLNIPIVNTAFDPRISGQTYQAGSDNLPNPGENVSMTLTIANLGATETAYTISLTSPDTRITVTNGNATTGSIPPAGSGPSTPITLTVGSDVYDGEEIALPVHLSNGTDQVDHILLLPIYAPDPQFFGYSFDGDGVLDPGEAANVSVTLLNAGGQTASGLTATVSSWDNAVSFPDASIDWPTMEPGQTGESSSTFRIQAANGVTRGREVQLRFEFAVGPTIVARKMMTINVGGVTAEVPTGPDAYGYYAYENTDPGFSKTPTFNWIELDPARGGNGDPHQIRDDTHYTMALPQPFTYYGQSFSNIWICSNGWVSFENATLPEFRNWEIPSPIGPPSMLCPFWDDLVGAGMGSVPINVQYNMWTRWDEGQNRFVIQWRNWNRRGWPSSPELPNADSCAFEIVLEYNGANDGDILFQYLIIANTDQLNNYATVGIQDHDHQRGLGLTYSDYYISSVSVLGPQKAIRFSTTPPDNFLGTEQPPTVAPREFALHEAFPNPFNPTTELRYDLPERGAVLLRVYDMLGREVAILVDDLQEAGSYHAKFDGTALATGLYFARLDAGSQSMVRKLMLVK